jgi:hypothetical protein
MVTFFCLLTGDPFQNSFPVDINNDQSIGHLKDLIKEKRQSVLGGVDAADLAIYNITIPRGDLSALEGAYSQIEQGEVTALDPLDTVSEVLCLPPTRCANIIVKVPGRLLSGASALPFLFAARSLPCMYLQMLTCGFLSCTCRCRPWLS